MTIGVFQTIKAPQDMDPNEQGQNKRVSCKQFAASPADGCQYRQRAGGGEGSVLGRRDNVLGVELTNGDPTESWFHAQDAQPTKGGGRYEGCA